MRLLKGLIIFNLINLIAASASNVEITEAADDEVEKIPARGQATVARRFAIFSSDGLPEVAGSTNDYEVYEGEDEDEDEAKVIEVKKRKSKGKKPRDSSTSSLIGISGGSSTSRLFSSFPVDKPIGGSSECSSHDSDCEMKKSDSETITELLTKIPDRFIVNESSGKYKFDSENDEDDDLYATSADLMSKRSSLYRLLAEIYIFFDTMDLDGFRDSLTQSPEILHNQSLKYHLIDNLLTRALKTKNEGTLELLGKFVGKIDAESVSKSVGNYENTIFSAFTKEIKNRSSPKGKSDKISNHFIVSLTEFLANESKRLNPLREYFHSGDFKGSKAMIEASCSAIYVTLNDFTLLLEQDCSPERYSFMIWTIENGHFNVHEMFGDKRITPLMLAAQAPKWSNDIVKAILVKAGSTTISATDSAGHKPLYYALNNSLLQKRHKKALVKMLELENPTYESLNLILNKYASKNNN